VNQILGLWHIAPGLGAIDICPDASAAATHALAVAWTLCLLANLHSAVWLLWGMSNWRSRRGGIVRIVWTSFGVRTLVIGVANVVNMLRCSIAGYHDPGETSFVHRNLPVKVVLAAVQLAVGAFALMPSAREAVQDMLLRAGVSFAHAGGHRGILRHGWGRARTG